MKRLPDDSSKPNSEFYGMSLDESAAVQLVQSAVRDIQPKFLIQFLSNSRTVAINAPSSDEYGDNFYQTALQLVQALGPFSEEENAYYQQMFLSTVVCVSCLSAFLRDCSDKIWITDPQTCLVAAVERVSPEVMCQLFALLNHWGPKPELGLLAARIKPLLGVMFGDWTALSEITKHEPYPAVTSKEWLDALGHRASYLPAVLDGLRFAVIFRSHLLTKSLETVGVPLPKKPKKKK